MIIDCALVHRLLKQQYPQWADLPLRPVTPGGWDNRTFRLGDEMCVRLPSAEAYAPQVEKEHFWLPRLAPMLPVPVPVPLAVGQPAEGYPWQWSIYAWLPGETAGSFLRNSDALALALAEFLTALQRIDPSGGPPPGLHNFFRGAPLATYDAEVRHALRTLDDRFGAEARRAWDESLAAVTDAPPVWLHGDFSADNLLVENGRLSAVIDFGSCGVGDPACDYAIAWSFLGQHGRAAFRSAMNVDEAGWLRGRGWALWKALIRLADAPGNGQASATLREILADAAAG